MKTQTRFERLKSAIWQAVMHRAELLADGSVLVMDGCSTRPEKYRSVQAAIDHYARYLPDDLKGY